MSQATSWIQRFLIAALAALMAISTVQADETITYIHWDALGSPVAATDEAGNVVWREAYRPYGERINNESAAGSHSRWYTGHPQDADTGLVYAGARYYDPVTGRFLAIDPVGVKEDNPHSFNRYAYANNNPYGYIDPDGREGVGPGIVMVDDDRFTGPFGTSGSVEQGTRQVVTILETADNVSSVVMPAKGAVSFVGKQAGKAIKKSLTRQARLRELASDEKLGTADRGWIKQEMNSIARGQRRNIRNPPGKDLAHERGREAAKGYGYEYSNLQDRTLHRLQHKYDNFGRKNNERVP